MHRGDGFYHSWCCEIIYIIRPAAVHPLWFLSVLFSTLNTYISAHECIRTQVSLRVTPRKQGDDAFEDTGTFNPFTYADSYSEPVRGSLRMT